MQDHVSTLQSQIWHSRLRDARDLSASTSRKGFDTGSDEPRTAAPRVKPSVPAKILEVPTETPETANEPDSIAAVATLLLTWAERGAELSRRYNEPLDVAGMSYDPATAHGRKMYDDLQECVLRYEELEPEEREKDVVVSDDGKEFRNPVAELIAEVGAGEGVTLKVVRGLHQMLVDDKKYLMSILAAGFVRVRGEGQIKLGHSKLHLVGPGSKEIVFVPKARLWANRPSSTSRGRSTGTSRHRTCAPNSTSATVIRSRWQARSCTRRSNSSRSLAPLRCWGGTRAMR